MNITNTVRKKLLARMRRLGSGKVHTSKDFLDLGSRDAVDQTLSRLTGSGTVKRLGRGLYYLPRVNPTLGITLAPDMDDVAQTLARKTGSRVIPSGAVAANRLGLSTQVPAKPVYLTDGRTRTVRVGNIVLLLKHAPPKDLPWGHPTSALVFLGLRHLGKGAIGDETISRLRRRLSPMDRRRLLKDIHYATDWVADVVREVCQSGSISREAQRG
ncbi:MAG: DUF6088 family protein [Elusimicrobiota bacterium]